MKRIFCFLLALVLLIPAAYADTSDLPTMTLKFSASATKVGDTVRVIASTKDAPVCASYHIIYSYDTAVLKPIEGDKLNTGGLCMVNIAPQEAGTINAVAADAAKVIEGDADLFYTDFEVIAAPADGSATTPLTVTYHEFYTPDTEKVLNLKVEPCSIPIIDSNTEKTPDADAPADDSEAETPSTEDASDEDVPVTNTPDSETPSGNEGGDASAESTPSSPIWETPTGDWELKEDEKEAVLVAPDGTTSTYTYEPIVDAETNAVTGAILYDENGHEIGTLELEQDEEGNTTVHRQAFYTKTDEKADLSFLYYLIPVGAAVLISGGLVVFTICKNKKNPEKEMETDDE